MEGSCFRSVMPESDELERRRLKKPPPERVELDRIEPLPLVLLLSYVSGESERRPKRPPRLREGEVACAGGGEGER